MHLATNLAVILAAASILSAAAAEKVPVEGSDAEFDVTITSNIGGNQVTLDLTGAALRRVVFWNVYAMASYVEKGARATNAEELARADVAKQLYLLLERDVTGPQMADAIKKSIIANHPEKEFPEDLERLMAFIRERSIAQGDRVCITHIPAVGLAIKIFHRETVRTVTIRNTKLARAIWDIYFGKNCLSEEIKKDLISRLGILHGPRTTISEKAARREPKA